MSQYRTGKVSIEHNSTTVTGIGTTWVTDGSWNGHIFKVRGENNIYWISSVGSTTELTLTYAYLNADAGDITKKEYAIVQDYTTNYDWPNIAAGDIDWPRIIRRTLQEIDKKFAERYIDFMTFEAIPSGTITTASGGSFYSVNSMITPRQGKLFYDAGYQAFLYYNGIMASVQKVDPSSGASGLIHYPQWRRLLHS